MTSNDPWTTITGLFVAYALGEETALGILAKIDAVRDAHPSSAGLDLQRVERIRAWIAEHELAQRRRAESFHGVNNAIAAATANLDLIDLLIGRESPHEPLLRDATPMDRSSVITGVGHTRDALKTLASRLRQMQDDELL